MNPFCPRPWMGLLLWKSLSGCGVLNTETWHRCVQQLDDDDKQKVVEGTSRKRAKGQHESRYEHGKWRTTWHKFSCLLLFLLEFDLVSMSKLGGPGGGEGRARGERRHPKATRKSSYFSFFFRIVVIQPKACHGTLMFCVVMPDHVTPSFQRAVS